MAHYARVNNGIVEEVLVAEAEFIDTYESPEPGEWVQTSYNTWKGQHALGGTPLRKNFAGVGFHYDGTGFYPPKPFQVGILIQRLINGNRLQHIQTMKKHMNGMNLQHLGMKFRIKLTNG